MPSAPFFRTAVACWVVSAVDSPRTRPRFAACGLLTKSCTLSAIDCSFWTWLWFFFVFNWYKTNDFSCFYRNLILECLKFLAVELSSILWTNANACKYTYRRWQSPKDIFNFILPEWQQETKIIKQKQIIYIQWQCRFYRLLATDLYPDFSNHQVLVALETIAVE